MPLPLGNVGAGSSSKLEELVQSLAATFMKSITSNGGPVANQNGQPAAVCKQTYMYEGKITKTKMSQLSFLFQRRIAFFFLPHLPNKRGRGRT